ncbi:MAG: hypothetical protein ACOCXQ_04740 [Patescibacteria group bacterium]
METFNLKFRHILVVFILSVVALFIGGFSYVNNLRRETVRKEIALYNQDQANQVKLSEGLLKIKEALGIAGMERESIDDVLSNVIKAKFGDNGFETEQALFVALSEEYPQITPELFAKAMDTANAERTAYANSQRITIQMVGEYESWLYDDLVRSPLLRLLGHPSNLLRADRGTEVIYGQAALEAMRRLVLVQEAVDATERGRQEPIVPFPPDSER